MIEDIAHALSLQCRYAGHVKKFYSVAEHSWWVSKVCSPENAMWGLLHDASEAYLVDLPGPLKRCSRLGDEYCRIERRLMSVICERFQLPQLGPEDVKRSDDFMLHWEGRDLMGSHPAPWFGEGTHLLPVETLDPVPAQAAECAFLRRFEQLFWARRLEEALKGTPWPEETPREHGDGHSVKQRREERRG